MRNLFHLTPQNEIKSSKVQFNFNLERRMKLKAGFVAPLLLWSVSLDAKDLGVHGATFEIKEKDILRVIEARLQVLSDFQILASLDQWHMRQLHQQRRYQSDPEHLHSGYTTVCV